MSVAVLVTSVCPQHTHPVAVLSTLGSASTYYAVLVMKFAIFADCFYVQLLYVHVASFLVSLRRAGDEPMDRQSSLRATCFRTSTIIYQYEVSTPCCICILLSVHITHLLVRIIVVRLLASCLADMCPIARITSSTA